MITLYHILPDKDPLGGSRNAAKAAILLNELGLAYRVENLDREKDLRPLNSVFRATVNPNGATPAIDHDGFMLWESGAVLVYLAQIHEGGRLLGPDPKARARTLQWLFWEASTFQPALLSVLRRRMKPPRDATSLEEAEARYADALGLLDRQLRDREFITGSFSAADVALGCMAVVGMRLGLALKPYAAAARWAETLATRDAFLAEPCFNADFRAALQTGMI